MNFMFSFGILSVFVSLIYGQYYPHRKPVSPKSFISSAKNNDNPFQRAYENQGKC